MSEVTVYVVRAVSMFAPNSQSARLAGSESKMERVVLAADYDRDVAEAEARGWNAALDEVGSARVRTLDPSLLDVLVALRKPEVEG